MSSDHALLPQLDADGAWRIHVVAVERAPLDRARASLLRRGERAYATPALAGCVARAVLAGLRHAHTTDRLPAGHPAAR